MRYLRTALLAAAAAAMALAPGEALAVEFGFQCVTANSPANCAAGESQFSLSVEESPGNRIRFNFRNLGPEPSSIARVYFDGAPTLWELYAIGSYPGTYFVAGGSPEELPGGTEVMPPFDADFRATAIKPEPLYGVNPGEKLKVVFSLAPGLSYSDALGQLMGGNVRVGLHAIGWTDDESDSFVNGPAKPHVVPEPPLTALFGVLALSCLYVGRLHRRMV